MYYGRAFLRMPYIARTRFEVEDTVGSILICPIAVSREQRHQKGEPWVSVK
jgi:hypothetical protein